LKAAQAPKDNRALRKNSLGRELPKRLFGYRARDVKAYIGKLEGEYASRIARAEAALRAALTERDDLLNKIASLKEQLKGYEGQALWLTRALDKARLTGDCIVEAARFRAEQLKAAVEKEIAEQGLYVLALQSQIADIRKGMEEDIAVLRQMLERRAERAETSTSDKVVVHILQSGGSVPFEITSSDKFLKIDMSVQRVKVVLPDGTEMGRLRHIVLDKTSDSVAGYEVVADGEGGADGRVFVVPTGAVVAVKKDALIVNGGVNAGRFEIPNQTQAERVERRDEKPIVERQVVDRSSTCEPDEAMEAAPFEARIRRSQLNYMVGKISGKDIVDGEGRPIISKGEVITAEIVEKARESGKLAELIVYMTIPGVETDDQAATAL